MRSTASASPRPAPRYVVAQYVTKPGDRWRSADPRAVTNDPAEAGSPMRGTEQ